MITFNLSGPLQALERNGEVFTWRKKRRPTGKQALFIKGKRAGTVLVHRLPSVALPESYAHYFNRAGFNSWPEWKTTAEVAHSCRIVMLALYRVHHEGSPCYVCEKKSDEGNEK